MTQSRQGLIFSLGEKILKVTVGRGLQFSRGGGGVLGAAPLQNFFFNFEPSESDSEAF